MIPNVEKTVEVTTNINPESTGQFTVDESALTHIMDVLTNLYSDPEGAVVREYSTNAYDSQVEAGMVPGTDSWRPIEVTTPSHFNKAYKIRDFGVGMDSTDLSETYSKYGKSTKTTSNDVVGMLGLGSKCALTYTNSFTITGFKGGIKTTAIVSKNEENIPVFHVVDTCVTDEPNGVEISIPVKSRDTFSEKTKSFFKYWAPGLVLVDGASVAHHGLTKISDETITYQVSGMPVTGKAEVYLVEGQGYWNRPQSRIIMGNVAYDIDEEYVSEDLRSANIGFVAYVPMGAVNFPPSRERLYFNTMTKGVIKDISKGLFDKIVQAKLDEISNASTKQEAHTKYYGMDNRMRTAAWANLRYNSQNFVASITHEIRSLGWNYDDTSSLAYSEKIMVSSLVSGDVVVVTGVNAEKPTAYFKKKVRHYAKTKGYNTTRAVLVENDFQNYWTDDCPRVTAEEIKAIKLPKTNAAPRKTEVPYDWYQRKDDQTASRTDLKVSGKKICYISPADMRETYRRRGTDVYALLHRIPEGYKVVVLGTNRFEKFLREHPHAVPARKVVQDYVNNLVNSMSDSQVLLESLGHFEREFLASANPDSLNDPDLADLVRTQKSTTKSDNYDKAQVIVRWAPSASMSITMPERKQVSDTVTTKYPLIRHVGGRSTRHLEIYCNAIYDAENQK